MRIVLVAIKKVLLLWIILYLNNLIGQDSYHIHNVKKNETLSGISELYDVTEDDILKLNPDIKNQIIRKKDVLIIPKKKTKETVNTLANSPKSFFHRVSRDESIEDITDNYDINENILKIYNPDLKRRNPKEGELLKIPVIEKENTPDDLKNTTENTHIIKKSETLWSVSQKYKLTVEELKKLNPFLVTSFREGDTIIIKKPSTKLLPPSVEKTNVINYIVKPKETLYAISKSHNVSIEAIEAINAELSTRGLYVGMVLKIPIALPPPVPNKKNENVQRGLNFISPRGSARSRLALVLPIQLDKINIDLPKEEVKKKLASNKLLNYSLDFYFGVLSAIDSLKNKPFNLDVLVVDSGNSRLDIKKEISKGTFDNIDVVLGPFYPDPYNELSAFLEDRNVPIFAPLSTKEIIQRRNTILTVPKDDSLREKILNYIEKTSNGERILIIADKENEKTVATIKTIFPDAISVDVSDSEDSVDIENLRDLIDPTDINIVFLETSKIELISNVTSVLNSLVSELCQIQMVTTYRSNNYDNNISNNYLSNLGFIYPVINRYSAKNKDFISNFLKTYGTYPNKYAIRGFDIAYDILSRISSDANWFANLGRTETEFLESRFKYISNSDAPGYVNEGAYIVQYKNLELEEIE